MQDLVLLEIDITGHFFKQWPYIKILLNDKLVFDNQIENTQVLKFEICCNKNNKLKIIHYNKFYGDKDIWHSDGINECWAQLNDIKFNDVTIGLHLKSKLLFQTDWTPNQLILHDSEFINKHSAFNCNGKITFNGYIELQFDTPVYNWLIINKYKTPITKTAYFSSSTQRWHYEQDVKILEEIKHLMNFK